MQNQINGQIPMGISSPAVSPQTNQTANYADIIQQAEAQLASDAQKLQQLIQQGVLNQAQGQFFITQLARRVNEINMYKNALAQASVSTPPSALTPAAPQPSPMDLFNTENPGFFEIGSRADVLNYIKDLDMDKDEISKIAKIVEALEKSAVDGYLKKSAHEKSLNDENSTAKSKLTSYAQNASNGNNMNRIFTRADIGKMSGEEFTKNEKLIMDQVKHGLIK